MKPRICIPYPIPRTFNFGIDCRNRIINRSPGNRIGYSLPAPRSPFDTRVKRKVEPDYEYMNSRTDKRISDFIDMRAHPGKFKNSWFRFAANLEKIVPRQILPVNSTCQNIVSGIYRSKRTDIPSFLPDPMLQLSFPYQAYL